MVRVVMITGASGSGKTTVLANLLSSLTAEAAETTETTTVAVCMHHAAKAFHLETGPLCATLAAHILHYSEVFDFGSGCVCCSPDGDLTRVLSSLAESMESGQISPLDVLFIEVTGLGDPAPFIKLFRYEHIRAHFDLEVTTKCSFI